MLGIAAFSTASLTGAVYQMLNHGISTGALFFMVGMLYERRHTRLISEFGGLRRVMPWFFATFFLITLSSIAVPGTNGFVGEFLILVGSWRFGPGFVIVASLGVVLAAAYLLWLYQRVFFGKVENPKNEKLKDLNARELATFLPLVALALWIGLYPKPFFRILDRPVATLVEQIDPQRVWNVQTQPGQTQPGHAQPEQAPNQTVRLAESTATLEVGK